MNRSQIEHLLNEASRVSKHLDFVIIGSLSVLGSVETPPERMVASIDVDLYPKNDPGRTAEIAEHLGLGSAFAADKGYYADPVSPALPTLPDGWQERLLHIEFPSGVSGWFLNPDDAAISKYARGEMRDREWIAAGIAAGLLSLATLAYRFRQTTFLDDAERERAQAMLAEDSARFGR